MIHQEYPIKNHVRQSLEWFESYWKHNTPLIKKTTAVVLIMKHTKTLIQLFDFDWFPCSSRFNNEVRTLSSQMMETKKIPNSI